MRFLISRLSSLGDVVHTLPAAVALKRGFPDCEIVWCADKRFAGIVELCEAVDQVVLWPKDYRAWKPIWAEIGEFDVAFDLQGLLKSSLVVAGASAKRKLGYHWRREFAWLFSQAVRPDPTSLHVTDQYVDVVRAIGAKGDGAEFLLSPDLEDMDKVRGLVPGEGPLVICNAGAAWASKRWPAKQFASLANSLHQQGVRVGRSVRDRVRQQRVTPGRLHPLPRSAGGRHPGQPVLHRGDG